MKEVIKKHKFHWSKKTFRYSAITALILLAASAIVNFYVNIYAEKSQSNAVTDIILDNIPTFNVGMIIAGIAVPIILFVLILLVLEPKRIPFVMKSVALFVFIRAIFVSLTHIGPSTDMLIINANRIVETIIGGKADLFFSGHAGLPFLLALIFWKNKGLRYTFLVTSLIGGASVLLGHIHYSIDVFASYFITYTIFHLAQKFFANDYKMLIK